MKCQDGEERNFRLSEKTLDKFVDKVCAINDSTTIHDIIGIIYDIYEEGLNNGQEFVWKVRAGDFGDKPIEDPQTFTITTNSNGTNTILEYKNGKFQEINDQGTWTA